MVLRWKLVWQLAPPLAVLLQAARTVVLAERLADGRVRHRQREDE
jgi:hypothetical protein